MIISPTKRTNSSNRVSGTRMWASPLLPDDLLAFLSAASFAAAGTVNDFVWFAVAAAGAAGVVVSAGVLVSSSVGCVCAVDSDKVASPKMAANSPGSDSSSKSKPNAASASDRPSTSSSNSSSAASPLSSAGGRSCPAVGNSSWYCLYRS